MDEINLQLGVEKALDALFAGRLALLCGAGLSMAAPSSLPSAATLAWKAKQKYDATYGADRLPLPESIDDQAEFFFQRDELASVYLRSYAYDLIQKLVPGLTEQKISEILGKELVAGEDYVI